jgi:hypothetical protein
MGKWWEECFNVYGLQIVTLASSYLIDKSLERHRRDGEDFGRRDGVDFTVATSTSARQESGLVSFKSRLQCPCIARLAMKGLRRSNIGSQKNKSLSPVFLQQ